MKYDITDGRKFFANRGRPRAPLRTITEMADEFGVSVGTLVALLRQRNGPSSVIQHKNKRSTGNTWYRPDELRQWWAEVKP